MLYGIGLLLAQPSIAEVPQDSYYVEISVEESRVVSGVADHGAIAGMRPGASDGFDIDVDEPEAPSPPQDFVRCFFFHEDWSSEFGTDFNVDYREPYDLEAESKVWLMQLETDRIGAYFEICFDLYPGSSTVAPMVLHDLDHDEWYDLLAEPCIEVFAGDALRQFDLYIGIPPETVLFVSPDGGGQYANIQSAIEASIVGGTVFLADGIYIGEGNRDLDFLGKSIALRSSSGIPESCRINCEGSSGDPHRGIVFQSGENEEALVEGITIEGGYGDEGGSIKCENGSSPTIRNCVLKDGYAESGAAIHCTGASNPQLEFVLIHSNESTTGGAIWAQSSSPSFLNCTVSHNQGALSGGAFLVSSSSSFENTVLSYSIDGAAIYCIDSSPILSCTNVIWNEGGDWVGCIEDQQNQNGNFSNTPAFCDLDDGDFRLQPGSPCLPEHNDCGVLVGALGEGDCAPTGTEEVSSVERGEISAYPNPFNPHLTIIFSLPEEAEGRLVIHDVAGRKIRMLGTGQLTQGINELIWNGQDDHGRNVASGVYFVRVVSEGWERTQKVVLLR